MMIDQVLLKKLSHIAQLSFTQKEQEALVEDLNAMLGFAKQLDRVVFEDIEDEAAPILGREDLREDIAKDTLTHSQALEQAPGGCSSYFKITSLKMSHTHKTSE